MPDICRFKKTESLLELIKERNQKQQYHCVSLGGYGFAVMRSVSYSHRIFKTISMSKMNFYQRIIAVLITIAGVILLVIAKS